MKNQCDGCRAGIPIINGIHDGGTYNTRFVQNIFRA
jgi:hypothetical protein